MAAYSGEVAMAAVEISLGGAKHQQDPQPVAVSFFLLLPTGTAHEGCPVDGSSKTCSRRL